MADTATLHRAGPAPTDTGPDIVHEVCDKHQDIALCGEDVTDQPWHPDDDPITCPLCVLADENGVTCGVPGCRKGRGWFRSLIHRLTGGRRG